jgi:hypothetical protein
VGTRIFRQVVRSLGFALSVAVGVGCGAEVENTAGGSESTGDAGSGSDSGTTTKLEYGGIVSLLVYPSAKNSALALASFGDIESVDRALASPTGCQCGSDLRAAPTLTLYDGAITLRSPEWTRRLPWDPEGTGIQMYYDDPEDDRWTSAESIVVESSGGPSVSPFAGTLQLPPAIEGASFGATPGTIDLAQDLTVTWTPDGPGGETMWLTVLQTNLQSSGPSSGICTCQVPDAAGSVTLSAELMSKNLFRSSSAGSDATLELSRRLASPVRRGNVLVTLLGFVEIDDQVAVK